MEEEVNDTERERINLTLNTYINYSIYVPHLNALFTNLNIRILSLTITLSFTVMIYSRLKSMVFSLDPSNQCHLLPIFSFPLSVRSLYISFSITFFSTKDLFRSFFFPSFVSRYHYEL